jgi:hypothetical protein
MDARAFSIVAIRGATKQRNHSSRRITKRKREGVKMKRAPVEEVESSASPSREKYFA